MQVALSTHQELPALLDNYYQEHKTTFESKISAFKQMLETLDLLLEKDVELALLDEQEIHYLQICLKFITELAQQYPQWNARQTAECSEEELFALYDAGFIGAMNYHQFRILFSLSSLSDDERIAFEKDLADFLYKKLAHEQISIN